MASGTRRPSRSMNVSVSSSAAETCGGVDAKRDVVQLNSRRASPVRISAANGMRLELSPIVRVAVYRNSGNAHRSPERFSRPLRRVGTALVMDLHPNDRGLKGALAGAVIANGRLYCPRTPAAPLHRRAMRPATTSAPTTGAVGQVPLSTARGPARAPLTKPAMLAPREHPPRCRGRRPGGIRNGSGASSGPRRPATALAKTADASLRHLPGCLHVDLLDSHRAEQRVRSRS